MLTAMNDQMLWNTGKPLWSDSKSTNVNFILETSQEMSSLILLHMINIFNGLTNGDAQTLFIFDNAPSH